MYDKKKYQVGTLSLMCMLRAFQNFTERLEKKKTSEKNETCKAVKVFLFSLCCFTNYLPFRYIYLYILLSHASTEI